MRSQASSRENRGLHGAALVGVLAVLFFHPGAMSMERLKADLLLLMALPVLFLALGPRRLARTASAPLRADLATFGLLPFFGILSYLFFTPLGAEGLRTAALFLCLLTLSVAVRHHAASLPYTLPTWLLAAGAIAGAYALLQSAGLDPLYLENPQQEAVSTLGNTNAMAEVAALLLPLNLALFLVPARGPFLLGLIALPLLSGGLWVTGGRAGILAALAGAALFLLLLFRQVGHFKNRIAMKRRTLALILALSLGGVLGGFLGADSSLALKNIDSEASILSPEYPTNKVRLALWRGTLDMIGDHPLLGAGMGRYRMAFPPYRLPEEARIPGLMGAATEAENPHNDYLWVAAEGGLPALLALVLFLFFLLRGAMKKAGDDEAALVRTGAAGTCLAFAVLCLFSSPLNHPASLAIFMLIAGQAVPKGMESRGSKRLALPALGILAAVSIWLGGRGLASDGLAAMAVVSDRPPAEIYESLGRASDLDPSNMDIANVVAQIEAKLVWEAQGGVHRPFRKETLHRLHLVLDRHPYHGGALKSLARLFASDGRIHRARRLIRNYLALGMEEGNREEMLARFLEEAGRHDDAAEVLLSTAPQGPARVLERAKALLEAGDARAAARFADRYLNVYPLDGDALHVFGKSLKALYDEGEKDVYRRMHLAYALDWIEAGDFRQAARSVKSSRRYGTSRGVAELLSAVIEEGLEGSFMPPEVTMRSPVFLERLKHLANQGVLPTASSTYIEGL